ncbi:hypothetical protein [Arthrobacter pascens]|uniref:hypothetical protein n=1 Tax=Arthrobacter pascens TaxID=1677 RepID=UPI00196A2B25|nr:hypothetical protein [Arthrobacter pascens]MBN3498853.1 hypothetical protein [Arthrobacter pascens]
MSITTASKKNRVLRSKIALVSAISLSLAAGSAALAAPAQAADSVTHATSAQSSPLFASAHITADTPYFAGFGAGWKRLVAYPGKVYYPSSGWVQVKQERWERDHWPDQNDYLGTSYFSKYFHSGGTFTFKSTYPLQRTDFGYGDKTEEVYHRLSYRVYKNGYWSPWSKWVYSDTASIYR